MSLQRFLAAGHAPTLAAAFLYFDVSFMVWVLLGAIGVQVAADLGLDPAQKGLMVATPVLGGALIRAACGVLVDRFGPKRTGVVAQLVVIAGVLAAWRLGLHDLPQVLAFGAVLGVAGASFAIALPLASRWYPPERQGLALGIAGAGNSGTVLASLFAPGLALAVGWRGVIGLAAIPLALAFLLFVLVARESPSRPAPKRWRDYLAVLKSADAWWLMLFYAVTFGGFVGLSSSLTIYFNGQYGLAPVTAGYCTAACVAAGSLLRPVGGALADRFGGLRLLTLVYVVAAAALAIVSFPLGSPWLALAVLVTATGALGMGNGAVFQLAPQRFGREIGVITGLVGMTGGVGGFWLASSLGLSRQLTGSYQDGFAAFAGLALTALASLVLLRRSGAAGWARAAATARA